MVNLKLNSEFNGIEIYFDSRPDATVLNQLHLNKWRWHKFKKCWYNKQTKENIEFAKSLCDNKDIENNIKINNLNTVGVENVHGVKVGDIFYTSWGYEQTNVSFYQVISITAKRAKVKQIKCTREESGFMSGYAKPIKDSFVDNAVVQTTGTGKMSIDKFLKNCDGNNHMGFFFNGEPVFYSFYG